MLNIKKGIKYFGYYCIIDSFCLASISVFLFISHYNFMFIIQNTLFSIIHLSIGNGILKLKSSARIFFIIYYSFNIIGYLIHSFDKIKFPYNIYPFITFLINIIGVYFFLRDDVKIIFIKVESQ